MGFLALTIDHPQPAKSRGFFLLFEAGKRPSRDEIKQFVAKQTAVTLSHDPAEFVPMNAGELSHADDACTNWVELLREGLTFDLQGLAPGPSSQYLAPIHKFDLNGLPGTGEFEALSLNAGDHLAGAEATLPVAKGMLGLARDFVLSFDGLRAVVWPQSRSAIGPRFFESSVTAWLDGGPFPALGLVAFDTDTSGAIETEGLDYWIGQELRVEGSLADDKVQATRIAVRIINHLVLAGGIEADEHMIAPDGSRLFLRLSSDRKFVQVARE